MTTRRHAWPTWAIVALLVLPGIAFAAKSISYPASTAAVAGTTAPFLNFVAGADSGAGDHVSGFALGANRTTFTATLTGYGGAKVIITDLVKIRNVHTASHGVVLTGVTLSNPKVTLASLEIFQGSTSLGVLDMKASSPSLSLGNVPAGATYTALATFRHAAGAGANDASPWTVRMVVTS